MRRTVVLGTLLLAGVAHAANLSTLDAMVKQGAKLSGVGNIDKAKLLCMPLC